MKKNMVDDKSTQDIEAQVNGNKNLAGELQFQFDNELMGVTPIGNKDDVKKISVPFQTLYPNLRSLIKQLEKVDTTNQFFFCGTTWCFISPVIIPLAVTVSKVVST